MDWQRMSMRGPASVAGVLVMLAVPAADAGPGVLANEPLFVSASAKPNILFLIDSSGSMSNIVPGSPYDPDTVYIANCPPENLIPAHSSVDISIVNQGPRIGGFGDRRLGTGAGQRCFDTAASYTARLNATNGSGPGGYLPAQYTGNYLNWYFNSTNTTPDWASGQRNKPGTQSRLAIAKNATTNLVGGLNNVRVGLASYSGGSGARIAEGIADLDAPKKAAVLAKIDALTASGSTPLAESLRDIGRYFVQGHDNTLTLHPGDVTRQTTSSAYTVFDHAPDYDGGVAQESPIQYFCQKNFAILLSDGRPQDDQGISSSSGLQDYDGDCIAASPACLANDRKADRSYESGGSDYLDDVAKALFEIDLRPDVDDFAGNEVLNNVLTYTIGFADDQVINDPLMQDTAANGGGLFLTANDAGELQAAFENATRDILAQVGSATAVAFNSSTLEADSALYLAQVDTTRWSGNLLALPIHSNGTLGSAIWNAAQVLDGMSPASRTVLGFDGGEGVAFQWVNLSAAQQADLKTNAAGGIDDDAMGQTRLAYLRGERSQEGAGNHFRIRTHVLGDLVDATPVYVAKPDLAWPDVAPFPSGPGETYADFKAGAAASRTPMVYTGANDGMLHGFRADTGEELLAYVPSNLFSSADKQGLHFLTDPNYTHRYYVDLTPTVSDAYVKTAPSAGRDWRTVLLGGERGGGRGLFALDITDPGLFSEAAMNAADTVIWEFDSDDDADLGYTFSKPTIALLNNGQWAAIFGNGYNDVGSGEATLFIVFLEGGWGGAWTLGTDYFKISTAAGDPADRNGLAAPALADLDGNGTVDRVYAGDLRGNLWAFDLTDSLASLWRVAYQSLGVPKPLFTAEVPAGTAQPITVKPVLIKHPVVEDSLSPPNLPNVLVLFGTGQYLVENDKTSSSTQAFYGVWDTGTGMLDRGDLVAQGLVAGPPADLRVPTDAEVPYTASDGSKRFGWFMDLPETGERVVANPKIRGDLVFFNTMIPNGAVCGSGGSGWLMSVKLLNGGPPVQAAFDRTKDNLIDAADYVTIDTVIYVPGGERFSEGIPAESGFLSDYQYTPGSAGGVDIRKIFPGTDPNLGRLSWREIRQ